MIHDTPLTDFSEIERISANGRTFVNADFARKLERDLNYATAGANFLYKEKAALEDDNATYALRVQELEKALTDALSTYDEIRKMRSIALGAYCSFCTTKRPEDYGSDHWSMKFKSYLANAQAQR